MQQYLLPTAQELFASLRGGQKFLKLDLSTAYQQVELDEASRNYVFINTHKGLYRYTRLSYSVACAPALFQEAMDKILEGLPAGCIIDDIIITGKTEKEHNRNLESTLRCLEAYGLKLNGKKCAWKQDSVEYFSYIVTAEGVLPSSKKVQAIWEVDPPGNVKELRSFLGLVNYYNKFLSDRTTTCAPLYKLLEQDIPWNWSSDYHKQFNKPKKMVTKAPVLAHCDPEKPLILAIDASPYGLGAVISHKMGEDKKPITLALHLQTSAEKYYSQIEKEGLAIMFGLLNFYLYLWGCQFILYTYHKPLMQIFGPMQSIPVQTASRLQR